MLSQFKMEDTIIGGFKNTQLMPIFNNTDSNKYIVLLDAYNNPVNIYNSAAYFETSTNSVWFVGFFESSTSVSYGIEYGSSKGFNTNSRGYFTASAVLLTEAMPCNMYFSGRSPWVPDISDIPVFTNKNEFIAYCTNPAQPQYTWTSVPAISGKNGILSLPTLIDTDGEPISGQSASVFSSLPEGSNVRALINGAL